MLSCSTGETQQTGTFLLIFHFWVHIIFPVIQKTAIKHCGTAMLNLACGDHAVKSVCGCERDINTDRDVCMERKIAVCSMDGQYGL